MRTQQGINKRLAQFWKDGLQWIAGEDAPRQRITVGMQSARWQAQQDVAGLHDRDSDQHVLFYNADDSSSEIKRARHIHIGHFRCFAAKQGAADIAAGVRYTVYDGGSLPWIEFAHREVVHKEQWPRPLRRQVVDGVMNEIVADTLKTPGLRRDQRLRANAI